MTAKPKPTFSWNDIDSVARTPEAPEGARTIEQLADAWKCSAKTAYIRARAYIKAGRMRRAGNGGAGGHRYWPVV